MRRALRSACLCLAACTCCGQGEEAIVISLPRGEQLRFIPVEVTENANLFSEKSFTVGNTRFSGEPVSRVSLSGTVFNGKKWVVPMLETELTQGQYAAVMDTPAPDTRATKLPQADISMSEVQLFLTRLNRLVIGGQGLRNIGSGKSASFFFRLPTAVEWEYAARGGAAVEPLVFDAPTPYGDENNFSKYEVFYSGTGTAKAKAVRGHRQANPLGLYDMLGNVAELVSPTYYFDSMQGRSGGLLVCGGCYSTERMALRSSERRECPPYRESGEEYRSPEVGFRLVIGSVIQHRGISLNEFRDEWTRFTETKTLPTATPTDSTLDRIEKAAREYQQEITSLRDELSQQAAKYKQLLSSHQHDEEDKQHLQEQLQAMNKTLQSLPDAAETQSQLRRMEERLKAAENTAAQGQSAAVVATVQMIGCICTYLNRDLVTKQQAETYLRGNSGGEDPLWQQKLTITNARIANGEAALEKICTLYADLPPAMLQAETARQQQQLSAAAETRFQLRCLQLGLEYAEYRRTKGQFGDIRAFEKKLQNIK